MGGARLCQECVSARGARRIASVVASFDATASVATVATSGNVE
jgi:hypothetical protein